MKASLSVAAIISLLAVMTSACGSRIGDPVAPSAVAPGPTSRAVAATPDLPFALPAQIYTTQNTLLGNRLIEGHTDLRIASVLDIKLDGEPVWLVSAPFENGAIFAAVMDNGQTQAFQIYGNTHESFDISPTQLPAGMPPLLVISEGDARLIAPPPDASLLTNPILIDDKLIYIASNGDLVLSGLTSQTRLPVNALPDTRILKDENERLLVLTGPTKRYPHGVLGDELEASGIAMIETNPEPRVIRSFLIESPDVIEGMSLIWADLDNDATSEVIVTLSNDQSGSRIAVFRDDGTWLAEGPAIGLGHRWRHQIAVASFEGSEKPPLIVDIRTPHIGGVVEFYQLNRESLEIVKEIAGFSAHSIGSRNLDSAIVGDFNNDGIHELLAPDQSHTNLGIISMDGPLTTIALDGVLTSNLSASVLNGNLIIGAGTNGNLRIWIP